MQFSSWIGILYRSAFGRSRRTVVLLDINYLIQTNEIYIF
jgi:hypothetical protein